MQDFTTILANKLRKIDELEERIRRIEEQILTPRYIPASEFLRKYSISSVTLWKLRKEGKIQYRKIGKKVFVLDALPER